MKTCLIILVFTIIIASSYSFLRQELVLFTGDNVDAEGVIIRNHRADFSDICFIEKARSYCVTGMWVLYSKTNFAYSSNTWVMVGANLCGNSNPVFLQRMQSARFMGSADLQSPGLSLYQNKSFLETETFFNQTSYSLFQRIEVNSLALSGGVPWTLYEFSNFTGNSVCIVPDAYFHYESNMEINGYPTVIGSVKQYCDNNVDRKIVLPKVHEGFYEITN